jgi:uncharacterized protein YbjT (DUF2867 family)
MKVAVSGASGLIGPALVPALLNDQRVPPARLLETGFTFRDAGHAAGLERAALER